MLLGYKCEAEALQILYMGPWKNTLIGILLFPSIMLFLMN